jgi:hypothetical protein
MRQTHDPALLNLGQLAHRRLDHHAGRQGAKGEKAMSPWWSGFIAGFLFFPFLTFILSFVGVFVHDWRLDRKKKRMMADKSDQAWAFRRGI